MKLIRFLLFPFAILYDAITRFRNFLFTTGILKSTSFDIPVIAVGNLSVGGTGKTPQIEYIIRLLKDEYQVAILSRGYKRKTKGFLIADQNVTVEDIGDEPMQFFKKFKDITVAVDADRVNGIQNLIKYKKPDVILLDDAFQHRKVKADYYILLTKYDDLFSDDFLLPTGNLRESKKGAKRANCVVVTKCPEDISLEERNKIKNKLQIQDNQDLFFTTIAYDESLKGGEELTINDLKNKQILLVTGIANPSPLLQFLSKKNINTIHLPYADHHHFTVKDIHKIEREFKSIENNGKIILTTEKDFVKLDSQLSSLCFLEIKTAFSQRRKEFNSLILNIVNK